MSAGDGIYRPYFPNGKRKVVKNGTFGIIARM
jgi:hypothetical protein